ncbi:energy transducer TonB family protein [Cupriavidus gilardii]|uniref:energy transducer TonB family protein n=1 Tax=Cupriavidus gilardii TaxID=82541 RepID=UPI0015811AFA|nr:TonB family protein [Cupriavidus gilardii]MCT9073730.1 TonB family protein [Cupriavidus gilardii]QKS65399.1 energy transducer TonB [Cupriavidus gilardii]
MARAVAISLAVHALLLAVRFGAPEAFAIKRSDTALDVVLVNAKSGQQPLKPAALAQADLDGGGDHQQQRATTPLPSQPVPRDGDLVRQVQRRVDLLEARQQRLMTQLRESAPPVHSQPLRPGERRLDTPARGQDEHDSLDEMARLEAEIGRNLEHYARRPKRHQITATSAQQVVYARYYDRLRRKIEARGTADFPRRAGQPLYGELIVAINVDGHGRLGYERGGYRVDGVELVKSSGNAALDRQAIAIVRAAAPFGEFSPEMRARYDILEVISTFEFSRSGLETRLQSR